MSATIPNGMLLSDLLKATGVTISDTAYARYSAGDITF
jgi:hypothetical protein